MKIKEMTLKTKKDKIIENFKEHIKIGKPINLKTQNGYIYYCGGALCKLVGDKMYTLINERWVEC